MGVEDDDDLGGGVIGQELGKVVHRLGVVVYVPLGPSGFLPLRFICSPIEQNLNVVNLF